MKPNTVLQQTRTLVIISTLLVCTFTPSIGSAYPRNTTLTHLAASSQINSLQRAARRHRARTYDVIHYIIRTRFDVPRKTVIGEVDIKLKPLFSGFKTFELDASHMKIEGVTLSDGTVLTSRSQANSLVIGLDRNYNPSDTITVRIRYRTIPQRGLYFIASSNSDGFQRPQQIWTQGEPEDNHYWFPCYDFPDDKATSEQFITIPANELAIANGVLVDTVNNPNGTRTFHWEMSQPHSSYLISLVIGDYALLTDTDDDVSFEYYTYRGTETQALRVFDKTPVMMRWFSNVLQRRFPYPRYAQTVIGDFIFGGMENITATTLLDTEILNSDESETHTSKLNLISHELAHSWFGDLVTCKDWSHLWLNEGFATFLEAAFIENQFGRDAYLLEMRKNAAYYLIDDLSRKRHPLVNPNYPLTMDLFDITTYKKGALVLHMLRETVGDESFWRALKVYLAEYQFENVDSRDLQNVIERVSGQSLDWFFNQWVYKAGYPELRVRAKYIASSRQLSLSVTQTQTPGLITPAVFRLPMDIEITTKSRVSIERIEVNRRSQEFVFSVDSRPQAVIIDKGFRNLKKLILPQTPSILGFVLQDGADIAAYHSNTTAPANSGALLTAMNNWNLQMPHNAASFVPANVPIFHISN
jgi:aminopeptidase N